MKIIMKTLAIFLAFLKAVVNLQHPDADHDVVLKTNLTACIGAGMSMSCSFKNKFAVITWSKETKTGLSDISDDDRFTITPHLQYGDVVIGYLGVKNLQKSDEGTYWCRAFVRREEHKNKTRLKVIECNEEALVILKIGQKNMTKRFKAFELFDGLETFAVTVDAGAKYVHYCSIVLPGSMEPLSYSNDRGEVHGPISLCTVAHNGVSYTSEVRFEERENCGEDNGTVVPKTRF